MILNLSCNHQHENNKCGTITLLCIIISPGSYHEVPCTIKDREDLFVVCRLKNKQKTDVNDTNSQL